MPRFNPVAAATPPVDEQHDGPVGAAPMGAITRHLLERERRSQERFGTVGTMKRPRLVLDALEAGEPVTVPVSLIPRRFHRPGWEQGARVRVTRDM